MSETEQKNYIRLKQDDQKYHKGYALKSVSLITLQNSEQATKGAKDKWDASIKQMEIDQHNIEAQANEIKSLHARLKNAKVNLEQTDVYAQNNGIVQNYF